MNVLIVCLPNLSEKTVSKEKVSLLVLPSLFWYLHRLALEEDGKGRDRGESDQMVVDSLGGGTQHCPTPEDPTPAKAR